MSFARAIRTGPNGIAFSQATFNILDLYINPNDVDVELRLHRAVLYSGVTGLRFFKIVGKVKLAVVRQSEEAFPAHS